MPKTLPAPAGGVRLSEFFEIHFLPRKLERRGVAESTVEEYRLALRRWIEIAGDPPLNQISGEGNKAFVDHLLSSTGRGGKPLSAVTARKHCRRIDAIISAADRADRARLHALMQSEIETRKLAREKTRKRVKAHKSPPAIPKPEAPGDPRAVPVFNADEIIRFFEASDRARHPSGIGISAGEFWRCLFALLWNSGLRIGEALSARRSMIASDELGTWIRLDKDARRFPCDPRGSTHRAEAFLNAQAQNAIERLSRATKRPDADSIVPWPFTPGFLGRAWREVLGNAGVPPQRLVELGTDAALAPNVYWLRCLKRGLPNLPASFNTYEEYRRNMANKYAAIQPLEIDQGRLAFGPD